MYIIVVIVSLSSQVLNLDELQSTIDPDQPTHITIAMTPTQVEACPEQGETNGGSSRPVQLEPTDSPATRGETIQLAPGTEPHEAVTPTESGTHSSDLSLSELTTTTQTYSLGAALPHLGSGGYAPWRKRGGKSQRKENRVTFKAPISEVTPQSEAATMFDQRPALLHVDLLMEPSERVGGGTRLRATDLSLQKEYPHLAKSLRQFDSLASSRRCASVESETSHPLPPLSIMDLTDQRETTRLLQAPTGRPPHMVMRPHPSPEPSTSLPLLHVPGEGYTLPGIVPPSSGLQPEGPQYHPPPAYHRQLVVPNNERTPNSTAPVTLPLLNILQQDPATIIRPASPPQSKPQPPPDYKLAQVPLQPYFPRLIPLHLLQQQQRASEAVVPPLLRLDDPLERMRRDGFQLLQLPLETKMDDPGRLLHVEPDLPRLSHPTAVRLPSTGRAEVPSTKPQVVPVACRASEETTVGYHMQAPIAPPTESRIRRRQKSKSR